MRVTHCTWIVCVNDGAHAERPLSFSASWISVCARLRMPMWPAPAENPGPRLSEELPWWTALPMGCHNSLLKDLSVHARLPLDLSPCALSMCRFTLYSFTISLSREDGYVLHPVSPLADHWHRSGLGDPQHGGQSRKQLCVQLDPIEKETRRKFTGVLKAVRVMKQSLPSFYLSAFFSPWVYIAFLIGRNEHF